MDTDKPIRYLNTDLVLQSNAAFPGLHAFLEAEGLLPLRYLRHEGKWSGWYESGEETSNPDACIDQILKVIERLPDATKRQWFRCKTRQFNIGFDCGREPWPFEAMVSEPTIKRIAAVGAQIAVTIYPMRD